MSRAWPFLVAVLAALALPPVRAAAAGVTVISSTARVDFPWGVTFTLEAASEAGISDVSLLLSLPNQRYGAYPRNVRPDFQPGSRILATWSWRRYGSQLPPGAEISYRWRITDAAGASLETPAATVRVEDTRFPWQELKSDSVTLRWYRGDEAFGRRLLDAATAAVTRLAHEQGVDLVRPVTVLVYGSQAELYSALPGTPPWIGGISIGEYDTVLVPIGPDDRGEGRRALLHELTHQLVYQITFNPGLGSHVPAWLNEGLAVVAEGETSRENRQALARAVQFDDLPTLRALVNAFSTLPGPDAQVAYAAAESVVRYLLREYGPERMRILLTRFGEGRTPDDALRAVYGTGQDGIEDGWRVSLGLRPRDRGGTPNVGDRPAAHARQPEVETRIVVAGAAAIAVLLAVSAVGSLLLVRRGRRASLSDSG
jgi:hypothetical protein